MVIQCQELKNYDSRYHDFREGKKERKFSNQTHLSVTDSDVTISRKNSYKKLRYKTHYSIDADSQVIINCYATIDSKS